MLYGNQFPSWALEFGIRRQVHDNIFVGAARRAVEPQSLNQLTDVGGARVMQHMALRARGRYMQLIVASYPELGPV